MTAQRRVMAGVEQAARSFLDWLARLAIVIAPPLLRIALAVPFFNSGLTKWQGFLSLSPAIAFLFEEEFKLHLFAATYDLPAPATLAFVTAILEMVLPAMLVLGLATRLSALGLLNDALRLYRLEETARAARVPTVATNDVLYHAPECRMLQDVVTCIREGCTIDNAGFRRERFADRFLKPPAEMARLFERHPDAIARTTEIAERCTFSLSELEYQYPSEVVEPGLTAQDTLGTQDRYQEGLPDKVAAQIRHELNLIDRLGYAPYFLTVNSIVRFARSKGIRWRPEPPPRDVSRHR